MRLIKCKQALEPVFMHAGSHGVSLSLDGFIVSHDEVMDAPVLFWMDNWKMILRERGVLGWGWGGLSLALRTTNVSRFGGSFGDISCCECNPGNCTKRLPDRWKTVLFLLQLHLSSLLYISFLNIVWYILSLPRIRV